jgi:hypothetical protein
MRAAISRDQDPVADWLFFHPGWLGYWLGMIWLMCPLLVFASRDFNFKYAEYSDEYLARMKNEIFVVIALPYLLCLGILWWKIRGIRTQSLSLQVSVTTLKAIA